MRHFKVKLVLLPARHSPRIAFDKRVARQQKNIPKKKRPPIYWWAFSICFTTSS